MICRRQFFAFLPLAVVARKLFLKPARVWQSKTYRFIGYDPGQGDHTHCRYFILNPNGTWSAKDIEWGPGQSIDGIRNLQISKKHFNDWGNV